MSSKSILSISSHVSHGYVGNRATVFPLQFTGWEVDAINTTNFSNHPGYGKFKGVASTANDISAIIEGLKEILSFNEDYSVILTGYTPNADVLQVLYDQLVCVFEADKRPLWVLDPVMGDNGKLYVSEEVIPLYKKLFSSGFVTLTTPNQFEFEILSETTISDWTSLKDAFLKFYKLYKVPNVVLSSVTIEGKMYGVGFAANFKNQIFYFPIDQINCNFNGCGDVFTALITNSFYINGQLLTPQVLSDVLIKLNNILRLSLHYEQEKTGSTEITMVKDIRIIPSRHYLLEDNRLDLIDKVKYID